MLARAEAGLCVGLTRLGAENRLTKTFTATQMATKKLWQTERAEFGDRP